jgi:hypothetical protein
MAGPEPVSENGPEGDEDTARLMHCVPVAVSRTVYHMMNWPSAFGSTLGAHVSPVVDHGGSPGKASDPPESHWVESEDVAQGVFTKSLLVL